MTLLFSTALLTLAWFAAINAASSVFAAWIANGCATVIRGTARTRARRLLVIRVMPLMSAAFVAGVLFGPAHFLLEPREPDETFGAAVYALAVLAIALIARGAWRAAAVVRTELHLRQWTRTAARVSEAREYDVWDVSALQGISLAGILRPCVLVGRSARLALTPAELELAVAHERAHQRAGDNLKRVLMYCVPDLFGGTPAGRRLEAAWRGETERLADDVATQGDPDRAVTLASALVKIARLGDEHTGHRCSPAWSTFHEPALLESRVRRLLGPMPPDGDSGAAFWPVVLPAAAVPAAWVTGLPARMHELTELLVQMIP